jgi:hypothetical protein
MPNDIDTTKPSASFKYTFQDCSKLECITKIDTTNATDTTDMFKNCYALTAPDAAAQADLTDDDGASWTNPNACP